MAHFQYQSLRDILKIQGDRMKEFVTKNREVKVQISRKKVANTQYSTAQHSTTQQNTMFTLFVSLSRRRSNDSRNRRDSATRRQDSKGRDYVRCFNRPQSQNHQDILEITHCHGQDKEITCKINQEFIFNQKNHLQEKGQLWEKRKRVLVTFIKGYQKDLIMLKTKTNHYGIVLKTLNKGDK